MKKQLKKVVRLLTITGILLTLCAPKINAESCIEDIDKCLDRLGLTTDKYEKALEIIDNNTKLIRELERADKKNVIFPYGGFRYLNGLIVPQVGMGYIRRVKRIGFKKHHFNLGVGGMIDFSFNSQGIHSIGCSFMLGFMF